MKKVVALVLMICVMFVMTACSGAQIPAASDTPAETGNAVESKPAVQEQDSGSETSGKTLTIGFSWAHKNDTLFYGMFDTLDAAVKATMGEHGYDKVEWIEVIAEDNAQTQADDIEDLISRGVDVIVVYAYDSIAIGSSIESAKAAGIPIILYDRAADPSVTQPDAFVGLDTVAQAYDAGKVFFQMMKDAGVTPNKIISIVGDLADQNALNRIEGFDKAAAEFGHKVEVTVPSEWNSDTALANFTTAWQANPDSNCVLIASDFIITAVQSVLEANNAWIPNGQEGHVWICAQDAFPIGLQYVRDGYIDVEGVYNLEGMADLFTSVLYDLIDGKTLENNYLTVGAGIMTKENVDTQTWWAHAYE